MAAQINVKFSHVKFRENPFSGSPVAVPYV
jgi:hypothetical protein